MTRFSELDLERQIAERLYAGAVASLELARASAERKEMYVNAFVKPVVPEQSEYPRRLLFSFLFFCIVADYMGSLLQFVCRCPQSYGLSAHWPQFRIHICCLTCRLEFVGTA